MENNLRILSRDTQWQSTGGTVGINEVNCGSFLRIADSMEIMAKDRVQLERDLAWYKQKYTERGEEIKRLEKSNVALRGHLKRLKNKIQ